MEFSKILTDGDRRIWNYSFERGWSLHFPSIHEEIKNKLLEDEKIVKYAERMGYGIQPKVVLCQEDSMIAAFERNEKEYLVHFEIDDFVKFVFVDDFPSLIEVIKKFQEIMKSHLEMINLIHDSSNEPDQS